MPWPLVVIPQPENFRDLRPGMAWFLKNGAGDQFMSNQYRHKWKHLRPRICVTLPDGAHWIVDNRAGDNTHFDGWNVEGELPNITVRPSIVSHRYHGWLTNGILSDDLEGRTYR